MAGSLRGARHPRDGAGLARDGSIMEKWEVVGRWKTGKIREQEEVGQAVVERRAAGALSWKDGELNPQPPWGRWREHGFPADPCGPS